MIVISITKLRDCRMHISHNDGIGRHAGLVFSLSALEEIPDVEPP